MEVELRELQARTEHDVSGVAGEAKPVVIVTTLLVCLGAWLCWYRWSQRHCKGPKTWPVVGVLIEVVANWNRIHDWMTEYLYRAHTIQSHAGFGFTGLVTVDPANVEHIMKTNFANYPKVLPLPPSPFYNFFSHRFRCSSTDCVILAIQKKCSQSKIKGYYLVDCVDCSSVVAIHTLDIK